MSKWLDFLLTDMTSAQKKVVITFCFRMLLIGHILWACSLLTPLGLQGFALAGDVQTVESKVSVIQSELLEQRIFETRLRQCGATSTEARRFYQEKLQDLIKRYQHVSGSAYQLPACAEVQ